MKLFITICLLFVGVDALAGSLTVNRPIRSNQILQATDLVRLTDLFPGTYHTIHNATGLETRVNLYPGRPIRMGELGPPALVHRNQTVRMIYRRAGLEIVVEGRALNRAGPGEDLLVMNLASRSSVRALVRANGEVEVLR